MFRVYKPKGDRVKAVQVTPETVQSIAETFMGRVLWNTERRPDGKDELVGVLIPTLDGVKDLELGTWIVRPDGQNPQFLADEEFNERYEIAKNTTRSE